MSLKNLSESKTFDAIDVGHYVTHISFTFANKQAISCL